MLLAGDIGGTNTRLALFDPKTLTPVKASVLRYPSGQYKSLEHILDRYLTDLPELLGGAKVKLKGAGFGVAGPVRDGKVKTTNLPWSLDARKLARQLKVKAVALVNDLYAAAAGIEVLPRSAFVVLRKGKRPRSGGTRAIIAPGTGLGHASLVWDGQRHIINPAEAGHIEFAPTSELEIRLLKYISAIDNPEKGFFKRCTYENLVSGPGLRNIYTFLVEAEDLPRNDRVAHAPEHEQAAMISQAGLEGTCPTSAKALALFTSIFARQAGNFALAVYAQDGIYLGGGIPPRILPALQRPQFLTTLSDKATQDWVKDVPVSVITNDLCGLYGAANCARRV
ncbi:MAG: glucokinase [Tepidisphaerales bacterium]